MGGRPGRFSKGGRPIENAREGVFPVFFLASSPGRPKGKLIIDLSGGFSARVHPQTRGNKGGAQGPFKDIHGR